MKVKGWTLRMQEGGHSKFYNVMLMPNGRLMLNWGRIGTAGQTKIEEYGNDTDAENVALRQVYAKAAKGYRIYITAFTFSVENPQPHIVESGYNMSRYMEAAYQKDQFTNRQELVFTHYDEFIETTNTMLDRAAKGESFDDLLDDWHKLSEAWALLDDKHEHAKVAVSMVQQAVSAKLMGV